MLQKILNKFAESSLAFFICQIQPKQGRTQAVSLQQ